MALSIMCLFKTSLLTLTLCLRVRNVLLTLLDALKSSKASLAVVTSKHTSIYPTHRLGIDLSGLMIYYPVNRFHHDT